MKIKFFMALAILLFIQTAYAAEWYVTGNGNDGNSGKSLERAFRSLQKAADLVQPGDIVWVGDGVYTNDNKESNGAVLSIKSSGSLNAWVTWKAIKGKHPVIRPYGWSGIQITGSYQVIDGLTVLGDNDAIVLLDALADAKKEQANPYFNTNGIFVNGRNEKPGAKPHHIIIRNCTVGKCPGGGIALIEADYLTVEDCKVFNNAWFMRYGGSGISTLSNWAYDDLPGYHVIIQRNYVWNNRTYVPWEKIGRLSDGNGIILDVTDNDLHGATNMNSDAVIKPGDSAKAAAQTARRPEWKGRALVANNLSAYNGGSGIHAFRTRFVDIVNNTTYWNGQNVGYPELYANSSQDIVFLNNIVVPRPKGKVTSDHKNTNIRWDYNLESIGQDVFKAPHDIVGDPLFTNVQPDLLKGDFHLKKGSSGLKNGTKELAQKTDINKKLRVNFNQDIGAFQQ